MRIYIVFCFISLQSDLQRRWKKEAWAAINDPEKKASGVGTGLGRGTFAICQLHYC